MKRKSYSLLKVLLMLLVFIPGILDAQEYTVTGTVKDSSNLETLPGVYIVIKGTSNGTITDANGTYSLKVPDANSVLVFSFLGYTSKEIPAAGNKIIDVDLQISATELSEIVVIGYGTVRKSDATGSVSVVGSDDFNKGAISSPQDLLVGKTAGVVITSTSGVPGGGSTIRIRGGSSMSASNDPLIVIDGVPIENEGPVGMSNGLATINPNDIESMTVLKDASATAIYGSRASNGVIIITTKKGGKNFKVTYNGNFSLNSVAGSLSVLNGDEYRSLIHSRYAPGSAPDTLLGSANTDWQKEIYKDAFAQDHNLGMSGTIKKIELPYRVSIGYTNQDGILKTSNFERTTLALDANPTLLNGHLKLDLNVKGMINNTRFAAQEAVGAAVSFDPTQEIYDPTSPSGYFNWTDGGKPRKIAVANPVARIDLTTDISKVKRSIGNFKADYQMHFLPELHAVMNAGYDYSQSNGHVDVPPTASWQYDELNGGGVNRDYDQTRKTELLDFYLNYAKDLSSISSRLEIMGGYSWQHFWREGSTYETNVYEDEAHKVVRTDVPYATENYLVSFFGRLNYSLQDKYLLTVNIRDDGSSRFSESNRWGLFPSLALAWKIKSESFLADVNSVSDLKLRLGYGITGQQDLNNGDYPYLPVYTYSSPDNTAQYPLGSTFFNTLRPEGYDINLKWEETTTYNIGLDFGFASNRITGSFDVYKRITNDLLNKVPVAAGSNLTNEIVTNVGNLENRGFEFSLNGKAVSTAKTTLQIGYNLSYNKNKITKLTLTDDPDFSVHVGDISGGVGNKIQIHTVGYPVFSYYVHQQVYDANNKPIEGLYVDRNKDGIINDNDKYRFQKPAPDVLMGISANLTHNNWDFSFSGRVSLNNYVYNNVASTNGTYYDLYNSGLNYLSNVLTSANEINFNSTQYYSDYYIENASFFRMDNISLGYRFNDIINSTLDIHIGAVVQNAFVITKYTGLDPEVDGGIDNNFYPRARTFLLGVTVDF